ncbi:MAG: hypothetical protein J0G33_09515 [Afipia felis]|nr:hypothetical protein [Afipia felis]
MLSQVQLRDFKPDVVICPHCTQHLMGVKDVQWAADCVSFTYGCAGCGHEIDRPVADEAIPASWSNAKAAPTPRSEPAPAADVTLMDDHPFPFRKSQESSRPFAFEATDAVADSKAAVAVDDPSDDIDNDDDSEDTTDDHAEPASFGSMRLLPPNPSWLDAPVFGQRSTLTPKQVFDTGRRDNERRDSERLDAPVPDAAVTTRASALLRDVSIFSL